MPNPAYAIMVLSLPILPPGGNAICSTSLWLELELEQLCFRCLSGCGRGLMSDLYLLRNLVLDVWLGCYCRSVRVAWVVAEAFRLGDLEVWRFPLQCC
jgi:hypothetical protein